MRIAVVGATGQVGAPAAEALERAGHEVVRVSRSAGVDIETGAGLAEALAGVDAVIDASNTPAQDEAEVVAFFGSATRNLLAAEQQAGVGHHVLLSIVGIDKDQDVPHYAGKREQERLVTAGPVPWSVVRATQFHELAARVASWSEADGVARIAPLLVQPVHPAEVGQVLAEVAAGAPLNALLDVAGPQTEDFVDMARRTYAARGQEITLVPTWQGAFDTSMAGEVLLPGPDARIMTGTFEDWLASGAQ
ncbi:MAG: NAD(P)H-binding protein [Nocardioidaceae bacterium]|nr:NAD(P)H-binding protein [Nocardioidaceae bacterium]